MIKKIFKWIEKNFSQMYNKDCHCCISNQKKFHKFVNYLNKLEKTDEKI